MAGSGSARPLGITVLAVLSFLGGLFLLLGGLGSLGLGVFLAAAAGVGFLFQILGLLALALGVFELAVGYGFWTLKPWAWTFAFVAFAIGILLDILRFFSWGGYGFSNILISIVLAGIVIYYLNQPTIRQAFKAPATGFPIVGEALDKYIPGSK